MKRIIPFLTVIFLFTSVIHAQKPEKGPAPALEIAGPLFDYGMIPHDGIVAHHYPLTNPHQDTITIVAVDGDCDCTKFDEPPIKIAPGETYLFWTQLNTKTYMGRTDRDLKIATDYEPNPNLTIYFTSIADVSPRTLDIKPGAIAFIPGIPERKLSITNKASEKAHFYIHFDNDSLLETSEIQFSIEPKESREIKIAVNTEGLATGSYNRSFTVEVLRDDQVFRFSVPVRINVF